MTTNSKHLTYEDRSCIECDLNNRDSIYKIANKLNKAHSTILREIAKNKTHIHTLSYGGALVCKNRYTCHKKYCDYNLDCYEIDQCLKLQSSPYVCNGCKSRNGCRKERYVYYAKEANKTYRNRLIDSRSGFDITEEEIHIIDKVIGPLITDQNQPINHVLINYPDILDFSKTTFYSYIDAGLFKFRNIDLNRKVRYKTRKNSKKRRTKTERIVRINRTYQDFLDYTLENPNCNIVEMDTVEGKKAGKAFLTLLWRKHNFMLVFLIDALTQECVKEVFKDIQDRLSYEEFKQLFEVILTDNGSEFLDTESIEFYHKTGEKVIKLFYCDPYRSDQKGSLEKNHEFIRYILPKGSSFNDLTQEDCNLIANHINSLCRESLNNQCPFKSMLFTTNEKTLNKMDMYYIEANDVILNDTLLKR